MQISINKKTVKNFHLEGTYCESPLTFLQIFENTERIKNWKASGKMYTDKYYQPNTVFIKISDYLEISLKVFYDEKRNDYKLILVALARSNYSESSEILETSTGYFPEKIGVLENLTEAEGGNALKNLVNYIK